MKMTEIEIAIDCEPRNTCKPPIIHLWGVYIVRAAVVTTEHVTPR